MAEIHFRELEELLCEAREKMCEPLEECDSLDEEVVCEAFELDEAAEIAHLIGTPEELCEDVAQMILGLSDGLYEGASVAFAYCDEVFFARVYDGERYVFPLPFMLSDSADAETACISLAEYSVREMVPLIITDVPRDELDFLMSVFPHIDAYTYEDDDDCFYVKVNNECDMLEDVPTLTLDGITLDELTDGDKERYATLCRDRDLNKYWGYDAASDNPDGDADFYLDTVRREMRDGVAIALAVREGGELVGEATVYGFDYRGCASIAVRVLQGCHGRGIGSRATRALIELSRNIGISTLYAEILEENVGSIKMTSKYMKLTKHKNGKVYFALSL